MSQKQSTRPTAVPKGASKKTQLPPVPNRGKSAAKPARNVTTRSFDKSRSDALTIQAGGVVLPRVNLPRAEDAGLLQDPYSLQMSDQGYRQEDAVQFTMEAKDCITRQLYSTLELANSDADPTGVVKRIIWNPPVVYRRGNSDVLYGSKTRGVFQDFNSARLKITNEGSQNILVHANSPRARIGSELPEVFNRVSRFKQEVRPGASVTVPIKQGDLSNTMGPVSLLYPESDEPTTHHQRVGYEIVDFFVVYDGVNRESNTPVLPDMAICRVEFTQEYIATREYPTGLTLVEDNAIAIGTYPDVRSMFALTPWVFPDTTFASSKAANPQIIVIGDPSDVCWVADLDGHGVLMFGPEAGSSQSREYENRNFENPRYTLVIPGIGFSLSKATSTFAYGPILNSFKYVKTSGRWELWNSDGSGPTTDLDGDWYGWPNTDANFGFIWDSEAVLKVANPHLKKWLRPKSQELQVELTSETILAFIEGAIQVLSLITLFL